MAGRQYAKLMDPNGHGGAPAPSNDNFDDMLASIRALGMDDVRV